MAHPTMVARKQAMAYQRLMAAAQLLAKKNNLTEEGAALAAITSRDPALAQAQQTEALANLLEGLAGTKTAAPKAAEIPKDAVGPVTVETVEVVPNTAGLVGTQALEPAVPKRSQPRRSEVT